MNSSENLDIRFPIGGLFIVIGALLAPYGWMIQRRSTPFADNIDLWWGALMFVFGAVLLLFARAARRPDLTQQRDSETSQSDSSNGD